MILRTAVLVIAATVSVLVLLIQSPRYCDRWDGTPTFHGGLPVCVQWTGSSLGRPTFFRDPQFQR